MAVDSEDYERFLVFLNPVGTISGFVYRLFDVDTFDEDPFNYMNFTQWEYLGGMAAIVAVTFGIMWWRYVPNE